MTAAGPPAAGRHRTIPAVLLRPAIVAVACGAFAVLPFRSACLAVALAVVGAIVPASLACWGAVVVVGLGQLAHPAAPADWRPYLALAVVHALHLLGGLTLTLPWRGRLRARALTPTLRRWLIVQLPAQAALAGVLLLQTLPVHGALPTGAAVIAAACGIVVIVVLLRTLAARR